MDRKEKDGSLTLTRRQIAVSNYFTLFITGLIAMTPSDVVNMSTDSIQEAVELILIEVEENE
jgi:hypothetical protein